MIDAGAMNGTRFARRPYLKHYALAVAPARTELPRPAAASRTGLGERGGVTFGTAGYAVGVCVPKSGGVAMQWICRFRWRSSAAAIVALAFFWFGFTPLGAVAGTTACNFYASPSGGGSGTTSGSPTTLSNAQNMAQSAPFNQSSRVICLETGTYNLGANLSFTSADTDETYIPYSGEWSATIDGGSVHYVQSVNASNFSIYGIIWQNLATNTNGSGDDIDFTGGSNIIFRWNKFPNCYKTCVGYDGTTNSVIDSNTILGSYGYTGCSGNCISIYSWDGSLTSGNVVGHNAISGCGVGAIGVSTGPTNGDIVNTSVTENLLTNNCTQSVDASGGNSCNGFTTAEGDEGAIYMGETGPHTLTNTGNSITYNKVLGCGNANQSTSCVYLDAGGSNVDVGGNICGPSVGYTNGSQSGVFQIGGVLLHGGQNNIVHNNVIPAGPGVTTSNFTSLFGDSTNLLVGTFYQTNAGGFGTNSGMGGNVYDCNLFYSFGNWPSPVFLVEISGQSGPVASRDNFNSANSSTPSNIGVTDTSDTFIDPGFANPTAGDYTPSTPPSCWVSIPSGQGPVTYAP